MNRDASRLAASGRGRFGGGSEVVGGGIVSHSNALTTSPGLLSSISTSSLRPASVATEMAHFSIPRSGALSGARRHRTGTIAPGRIAVARLGLRAWCS